MDQSKALRCILALSSSNLDSERKEEIIDDILTRLVEFKRPESKLEAELCSDVGSTDVDGGSKSEGLEKKKRRPKSVSRPLDKEDFARRFRDDPLSIKKWELSKAIGKKNGYGLNELCPDVEGAPHSGVKIVKQTTDVLRSIIAKHLEVDLETYNKGGAVAEE